jgi:hypothetical protein
MLKHLADVFKFLSQFETELIRHATSAELEKLEEPSEYNGLPVFRKIQVFLSPEEKENHPPLYMIFVDNGIIHYSDGDYLCDFALDQECFFADGSLDYETLFGKLFLDGATDLASFAGFFVLKD